MIEQMKKISLIMSSRDACPYIGDLQELGAVHVQESEDPITEQEQDLIATLQDNKKILSQLHSFRNHKIKSEPYTGNAKQWNEKVRQGLKNLSNLLREKEILTRQLKQLETWGEYNPDSIEKLKDKGIFITFHICSSRNFNEIDVPGGILEVISRTKDKVYFILIGQEEGLYATASLICENMPETGSDALNSELLKAEESIAKLELLLSLKEQQTAILESENDLLEDLKALHRTRNSLNNDTSEAFTLLEGYIPHSRLEDLSTYVSQRDIVLLTEDSEDPAVVPIKLRNRPFSRLFEPITKIFGLPSYVELDTTPFLAPFFALFFGLCLADIGYGLIVVVMATTALFAVKNKSMKPIAVLGIVLGLMTIGGGLILNTVFGSKLSDLSTLPDGVRSLIILKDINDAMAFAIMLGVVQVLFGFLLQMVNHFRQEGWQGGLQPIGTFLFISGLVMFLMLRMLEPGFHVGPIPVMPWILRIPNPSRTALILMASGVFLILFFNNTKKKVFIRPLLGLWEMYGIISGVPGDIISYIRLFALSLAGGLLGGAINQIAFMVRGDEPSAITLIPMLLILILGHAINFALAALSAFVHPLRLTFVEFYKAVGFTGGGIPYKPFMKKTANDGGKR